MLPIFPVIPTKLIPQKKAAGDMFGGGGGGTLKKKGRKKRNGHEASEGPTGILGPLIKTLTPKAEIIAIEQFRNSLLCN